MLRQMLKEQRKVQMLLSIDIMSTPLQHYVIVFILCNARCSKRLQTHCIDQDKQILVIKKSVNIF